MNPLIPFFVVTPLAGAFLIMIAGRFIKESDKYLTSLILLFLAIHYHVYTNRYFINWFPASYFIYRQIVTYGGKGIKTDDGKKKKNQ